MARASASTNSAACRGGWGVPASLDAKLPPSTNSIEKKGRPSISPMS